jgi:hypothetical protein
MYVLCTFVLVCVCVRIYACIVCPAFINVCMYVWMLQCMCVCMNSTKTIRVCMYVCMYE